MRGRFYTISKTDCLPSLRVRTIQVKAVVDKVEQVELDEEESGGVWSLTATFHEGENQKVHSVRFYDEVTYEPGEEVLVMT